MCLEDLRLGRGRYVKKTTSFATNSIPLALAADASRVAVIASFYGWTTFDGTGNFGYNDYCQIYQGYYANANTIATLRWYNSNLTLRVEDLGQIVTGVISVAINQASGVAVLWLTEICTDVNAPPLDTYKP